MKSRAGGDPSTSRRRARRSSSTCALAASAGLTMVGPDGQEYPSDGHFGVVEPLERLSFGEQSTDHPMLDSGETTVEFIDLGDSRTNVVVTSRMICADELVEMAKLGSGSQLDKPHRCSRTEPFTAAAPDRVGTAGCAARPREGRPGGTGVSEPYRRARRGFRRARALHDAVGGARRRRRRDADRQERRVRVRLLEARRDVRAHHAGRGPAALRRDRQARRARPAGDDHRDRPRGAARHHRRRRARGRRRS